MPTIFYAGHTDPGFLIHCLQRLEVTHSSCFDFAGPSTPLKVSIFPLLQYSTVRDGIKSILLILQDSHRVTKLISDTDFSSECINDVNEGNARIFIDYTNESGTPELCRQLESSLVSKGVRNLEQIYLVCQNRELSFPNGDCRIKILNLDFFLIVSYLNLIEKVDDHYISRMTASIDCPRLKADVLCLNATPRLHRLLILLYLYDAGIIRLKVPNSIVSFPGYEYDKEGGLCRESVVQLIERHEPRLAASLEELETFFPLVADNTQGRTGNNLAFYVDIRHYLNSKLSIVTETSWVSGHLRITEKTLKPLLLGHPLIVLGHPGTARLIKDFGFMLNAPDVQEEIDNETNFQRKCVLIASAAKELISKYNNKTYRESIKATAMHNMAWGRDSFIFKYCSDWVEPLWRHIVSPSAL